MYNTIDGYVEFADEGTKGQGQDTQPCYKRFYDSKPLQLIKELLLLTICLSPLCDLATDIITIYLYFDTNNPTWFTISVILLSYSLRTQFVFCMIVGPSQAVHAIDPRFYLASPKKPFNLLLFIPYFGASILCTRSCTVTLYADTGDITTKEVTEVDWSEFDIKNFILACCCAIFSECCFVSFGIIASPIVVIYVVAKKFMNHFINIMEMCNCITSGDYNGKKSQDKDKGLDSDESMFIMLTLAQALTEALPQLILQCFIFMTQNIYTDTNSVILFTLSVTMSIVSLLKLIYKMIANREDVINSFTIEVEST